MESIEGANHREQLIEDLTDLMKGGKLDVTKCNGGNFRKPLIINNGNGVTVVALLTLPALDVTKCNGV